MSVVGSPANGLFKEVEIIKMKRKTRTDAVRASLRVPRAILTIGLASLGLVVAAVAGLLLASPGSRPLLMNVERVAPHHELVPAALDRQIAPEGAVEAAYARPERRSHGAEENVRWLSDDVQYFNGRPIRPVKTMTMTVTAYSPDERSCGKWADGITASGYSVWTNGMKLVAADTRILPFGSLISIPGYDNENIVPVLDRGGAIKGKRLDVLYPTHERARQWGVQELEVTIWEYADGGPNDFRTNHRRR